MKNLMSRHVVVDGHDYGLAIARIEGKKVCVVPFREEEPGVEYHDEKVVISTSGNGNSDAPKITFIS